jgi:DNA-binding transcriptional MerR regulator
MRRTYVAEVPDAKLLTTAQAAARLGIDRRTLARYAQQKLLTPTLVLPSGHLRWDMADIRRQLRERGEVG